MIFHDCTQCTNECRLQALEAVRDEYSSIDSFKYTPQVHSKPKSILLGLTNKCNLNCNYCFVHQNSLDMTFDVADKGIQWVLSNCQEDEKPTVGFFGGEPLLKFNDIIVPIVQKYKDKVNFSITTNGILLNEDIIDFLHDYEIYPLLSFDGVPEVQNKQRSNSFNQVLKNIPYLLLRFPEITMRATVTKESIPYLYDTVLMADELGFKHIFFCENAYEDWDKEIEKELEEQFKKIGLFIYKRLRNKESVLKIDPFNRIFESIDKGQHNELYFDNRIIRCGLGTTSCAITPDGNIIPCQEKISNITHIIGNIYTGIDYKKHKEFLIDYFNKVNNLSCDKGCSDKNKLICLSHLCPSRLEDLNYQFSTASCAFSRMATKICLRLFFLCSYSIEPNIREYWGGGLN